MDAANVSMFIDAPLRDAARARASHRRSPAAKRWSRPSIGKRIDYKSASRGAGARDAARPQRRRATTTATRVDHGDRSRRAAGAAARKQSRSAADTNADARIVRAGNERWLVVKATPEQAWNTMRQFWTDIGFVLAVEQPHDRHHGNRLGREPRRDSARIRCAGRSASTSTSSTRRYKRDKFRTRIERGAEPGTVEIYISHRGMEQVPTAKIDSSLAGRVRVGGAAAESRPRSRDADAADDALRRARAQAAQRPCASTRAAAGARARARSRRARDGSSKLVVDDAFDRAWRRVGLALDRIGFTVVDRDRSQRRVFRPLRRSRQRRREGTRPGLARQAHVLEDRREGTPEQYRITSSEADADAARHRAGSERRARQDARPARRSSRCLKRPAASTPALRAMRFASLGSGSEGNGLVVEAGAHAGPDRLRVRRARHRRAPRPARARAVVARRRSSSPTSTPITSAASPAFAARYDIPVWRRSARSPPSASASRACRASTASTATTCSRSARSRSRPFPVPHDAREPVQFVVGDGARRLGVLTDIGMSTPYVEACLSGCDALVLECNHDLDDARERRLSVSAEAAHRGPLRPPAQRSGGGAAARASTRRASSTSSPRTCRSRTTRPSSRAPRSPAALGCAPDWIGIADQACGFGWREL